MKSQVDQCGYLEAIHISKLTHYQKQSLDYYKIMLKFVKNFLKNSSEILLDQRFKNKDEEVEYKTDNYNMNMVKIKILIKMIELTMTIIIMLIFFM